MEYKRISEINFAENINSKVFGIFLATDVVVKTQKDNVSKYISLTMVDRTVKLDAKKFGVTEKEIRDFVSGRVYKCAIDIKEYSKSPYGYSCNIYNFEETADNPADFIEWASGLDEAVNTINLALSKIKDTVYGQLTHSLLVENWGVFSSWAAGKSHHHNVLGGLLKHTAEVLTQCDILGQYWNSIYGDNFIDMPLILSASMLHDIAKTRELTVNTLTGEVDYSKEAALSTHITTGILMVQRKCDELKIGMKTDDKTDEQVEKEIEAVRLLEHCILAHHGEYEFGSPIEPSIPEAYLLSKADLMSAELYKINRTLKDVEPGKSKTEWRNNKMVHTYKTSIK